MAGFPSPDVPAYLCYAVVLAVGLIVARSSVNRLLAAYPDHWAFVGTWSLLAAYVILPIGLFWFLDYTGALKDTSLFAALVVAAGYRQIFAGGVQGITMPGQTPALWRPFEEWVKRVADRIATRNKQYRDRFDERVRSFIAGDTQRLGDFENLTFERSRDAVTLQASLAPYKTTPPPPGAAARILDILWRELRSSEPDNYGYLLYKSRLVSWWQYWRWLENGRSKLISAGVAVLLIGVLVGTYSWMRFESTSGFGQWQRAILSYHQWRFLKHNTSERDRWRSREYLAHEIRQNVEAANQAASQGTLDPPSTERRAQIALPTQPLTALREIVMPLILELRYPDVGPVQADDVTRLLVDCHSTPVDGASLPELIESLRTKNDSVRLLIHRTLQAIQKADYATNALVSGLVEWVPAKDESPADIDERVRAWHQWWHSANAAGH